MTSASPLPDAVVVVIERDDGRILFVQRPAHDSYPGYWNPVTGACEESDGKRFPATCIREAREEVGLEIEVLGKIWQSETIGKHYTMHWFLARPVGAVNITPDPAEVSGYRWLAVSDIATLEPAFADTRRFFAEVWPKVYVQVIRRDKHA
ncbi:MAG: NUDIX hydrolase [Planctomycetaceae bacterium]|nr:NUDIX hydrolase [Planctomycetaceae bacterium]